MIIYWLCEIMILLLLLIYNSYFVRRFIQLYVRKNLTLAASTMICTSLLIIILFIRIKFPFYAIVLMQVLGVCILLESLYYCLKRYKYYKLLHTSGVLLLILTTSLVIYNRYRMQQVIQTTYEITSDKIDSLKILQITDLHMSDSMNVDQIRRYTKQMNNLDIDLVLLTGDIFEEKTTYSEVQEVAQILGQIYNTLGIYYIYGNHDSITIDDKRDYTSEDIKLILENNNIIVLEDEVMSLNGITIIGRKDRGLKKDNERASMDDLILNVDLNTYIIVIDHQPLDIEKNASLGVDLQLSGHTHGGYVYPLASIQSMFTNQHPYGIKNIGDFTAITSSGISFSKQTGAPNEYVYIVIN